MNSGVNRRDFIKAVGVSTAAMAFPGMLHGDNKKPMNIVLIMADDVSQDMYGCYGNTEVKTPHIDRMAKEGVMFRTAWATPMCSPTRAMLMTGRYANRTKFYHNALRLVNPSERADLVGNNLTFGKLLHDAGYATAVAGKWHVTGDSAYSDAGGFDEHSLWIGKRELEALPGKPSFDGLWENEDTTSRYWHPCIAQNHRLVKTESEDFGTKVHTDYLCDFIERKKDVPFFAYFPMAAPHGTREGHTTTPLRGESGVFDKVRGQEQRDRFKALNEYIDVSVGRIVTQIERLGLLENTMIIFTSDNGTAVTAKTRAVERGARVPFVVYGGGTRARGVTEELTDLTDVLPTLLEVAGVSLPDGYEIDGRSLGPFLRGETDTHREWIYSYIGTSQMRYVTDA